MKNLARYTIVLFLLSGIFSCQKDKIPPQTSNAIISPEFTDNLLFVNQNNFKILTSTSAEFSSSDPSIQISPDGVVKRITSGEIAAIDLSWNDGNKTRIYALGATDDNHDEPYSSYHGKIATDAYDSYRRGWKILQKLPAADQTYGIILRHGDADDGRDYTSANPGKDQPPNWWKSCDPTLARQLNARGKARSAELGKIFKELNYPISRVISSEFCRAVQTAELINSGPLITKDERINHPEHNTTGKGLFNGMLEVMKEQPVDNHMTLLVMHHPVNETSSAGYPTFPLCSPFTWAGAYIVSVSPDKTITYQGAVSFPMVNYWRNLKLKRL